MNNLFDPSVAVSQMKLPPQNIDHLTFCSSNKPNKVADWINNLKLTQVNLTSVALYQALSEINHLRISSKNRSEILEMIRPAVDQCNQGLAKDFLQQPLVLSPGAQKTALLAQAMEKSLLDGYMLCAKELVDAKKLRPAQLDLLSHSLFHACLCINTILLRCYQLYSQAPANLWQQLHSIFLIAEFYELLEEPIARSHKTSQAARNVYEAYIQGLALASLRPNQLSQYDIGVVHKALGQWTKLIHLDDSSDSSSPLILVNLSSDLGPAHKSRFHCEQFDRVLELNVEQVVQKLEGQNNASSSSPSDSNLRNHQANPLPTGMQVHIVECWNHSPARTKERKRADIEAQACVGLVNCHKKICGDTAFNDFIDPQKETVEVEPDSFGMGNFNELVNSLASKKDIDQDTPETHDVIDVLVQNISSGGYCLLWQGELGSKIEAGELIGIKELGRRSWNIGIIRWIRKLRAGSQLGVQLLTRQPAPYGASCMYDMGGYSDPMRAIHIPAPATEDQPPSLLTAAVPFQENTRVRLKQEETELDVRLTKCLLYTSKIRLFSFDTLTSEA